MRNLVALAARPHALSFAESSAAAARRLDAVAVDGESGRLFSASSLPDGALTNFQIHLHPRAHVPHHADAHTASELGASENARLLCAFAAPTAPDGPRRSAVVSLQFLPDGGPAGEAAIVILTAGGDIGLLSLSDLNNYHSFGAAPPTPEIVGSVEQGILAAAWSLDEESLVLITARSADEREKVLVMSRDWEVLSEGLLDTQDLGTGELSCICLMLQDLRLLSNRHVRQRGLGLCRDAVPWQGGKGSGGGCRSGRSLDVVSARFGTERG
jgi:elongator complex protein 1